MDYNIQGRLQLLSLTTTTVTKSTITVGQLAIRPHTRQQGREDHMSDSDRRHSELYLCCHVTTGQHTLSLIQYPPP